MIWVKAVQEDLQKADWISIKIDSANENIWKKINKPHGFLILKRIIQALEEFVCSFKGILTTETMIVKNVNDDAESIYKTAELIRLINPKKSYILVPIRPPAKSWVKIPGEVELNEAFQIFSNLNINTELLIHGEGTDFTFTSDAEKELLSILAVHPMSLDAVEMFLSNANIDWNIIDELLDNRILKEVEYSGNTFFIKNIKANNSEIHSEYEYSQIRQKKINKKHTLKQNLCRIK